VSGFVQGTYTFNLTVTDNGGKTATDAVVVTVNAAAAPPPVNQAPTANAGADISFQLPTSSTNLNGSNSKDPDGTISKYAWTQASGPGTALFGNASAATTAVSGLVQGTYTFNLTVTDNGGKTATDAVVVTVKAALVVNQAPTANAGTDLSITLPTSSTNLNGSNSKDPDGTISKYAWTEASGPSTAIFGNAGAATTAVSGLVQGTYTFNLTVIDNGGKTSTDAVVVTVNDAHVNLAPTANAGTDITIQLPTSSTNLNGSKSKDPDGTISKYAWSQASGPSTAIFGNSGAATTAVSGLVQGAYTFNLTVTDNGGKTAADAVVVTVKAAPVANQPPPPNTAPVAVANDTVVITLPVQNTLLDGSKSYDDAGSISAYNWTFVSGPDSAILVDPDQATALAKDLVAGVYVFSLTVTDNQGTTSSKNVTVIVLNSSARAQTTTVMYYPNPAQSVTTLKVEGSSRGKATLQIYNGGGAMVSSETLYIDQQIFTKEINLSRYANGTYYMMLKIGSSQPIMRRLQKL